MKICSGELFVCIVLESWRMVRGVPNWQFCIVADNLLCEGRAAWRVPSPSGSLNMLWVIIIASIYGLFSKRYKRLRRYEKAKRRRAREERKSGKS